MGGIVILSRDEQPLNAQYPIKLTEEGISISFNEEQPLQKDS